MATEDYRGCQRHSPDKAKINFVEKLYSFDADQVGSGQVVIYKCANVSRCIMIM